MAVQLYEKNQKSFIKALPETIDAPLQKINECFGNNHAVTEELLNFVGEWLEIYLINNPNRYLHSISTAQTAEEIAGIIGYINPLKAHMAGMIHDIGKTTAKKITKKASEEKMQKLSKKLKEQGIEFLDSEIIFYESKKERTKFLHAPIGKLMAEKKLGIKDSEILNAIRFHTIGINLNGLDTLSKIIIIADKIEPLKRGNSIYNEIMDILRVTKNPDIALNALRNRLQQAA